MSKRSVENIIKKGFSNGGRSLLHYQFPDDIEYYFCAFELVDSTNKTVEYFAFPIMPKSIFCQKDQITNIKRTFGGINTLKNPTFDPVSYTLTGDFGSISLKTIIGGVLYSFMGINFNRNKNIARPLSVSVKTGYGCIKILERIFDLSDKLDEFGNPHKLFFYNASLNHNYIVEPESLTFSQSYKENMIWQYNLRMKAVSDLSMTNTLRRFDLLNNLATDQISKKANALLDRLRRIA